MVVRANCGRFKTKFDHRKTVNDRTVLVSVVALHMKIFNRSPLPYGFANQHQGGACSQG